VAASIRRLLRPIMRRLRAAPLEIALPAAGLLAGFLVGPVAWWVLRATALNYQASVKLTAFAQGREREAAGRLAARAGSDEFRKAWLEKADALGLRGARRLDIEVDPEIAGAIELACQGRPGQAVVSALASARESLTDPKTPALQLKAPDLEQRIKEAQKLIADLRSQLAAKEAEEKKAGPVGDEGAALAALEEKLGAKDAEIESIGKAGKAAGDEAETNARLQKLQEEVKSSPGTPASAAERQKLLAERDALQRLFVSLSREDCTAEHPVVRRLARIQQELRLAELPGLIAEAQKQLEDCRARRQELEQLRKDRAALARERDAEKARVERGHAVRDKVTQDIGQIRRQLSEKETALAALANEPMISVKVEAAGPITMRLPLGGLIWLFLLAGLVLGVVLAFAAYRRLLPRLAVIDDEASLANKVHVPVLGVVPVLAVLSRR